MLAESINRSHTLRMIRDDGRSLDDRRSDTVAQRGAALMQSVLSQTLAIPAKARWIGCGFAAGMVFWHVVGFWTFMNRVVFDGPQTARTSTDSLTYADIETGSIKPLDKRIVKAGIAKVETNCTSLVRTKTGTTEPRACERPRRPLKQVAGHERGDRLAATATALQPAPVPAQTDWTAVLEPIENTKLQLP